MNQNRRWSPGGRKFHNVPTRSAVTGVLYQSKKEAAREPVLLALEAAGEIRDMQRQVSFALEVYNTTMVEQLLAIIAGKESLEAIARQAQIVERAKHKVCRYVADFVYLGKNGALAVEDVKSPGTRTPIYSVKKKLMLACLGIEVQEPEPSGVQMRARGCGVKGRGTGSRFR